MLYSSLCFIFSSPQCNNTSPINLLSVFFSLVDFLLIHYCHIFVLVSEPISFCQSPLPWICLVIEKPTCQIQSSYFAESHYTATKLKNVEIINCNKHICWNKNNYYIPLVLSLILLVKFSHVINKYKWYSSAVEYHSCSYAILLL